MRLVRRFLWFIALTAAAAVIAALAVSLGQKPLPGSSILYMLTVPIPFLAAGIFVLWRQPANRSGWLLVAGTAATMAYAALLERIVVDRFEQSGAEPWMSWALFAEALVMTVGLACLALLIGLFPTGTARTSGERRFARWVWFLPVPMLIGLLANDTILVETISYGGVGPFENPLHIEALGWLGPVTSSIRPILGSVLLGAIAMLVMRYRREATAERRQIRWVLFGSAFAMLVGIVPFILQPLLDPESFIHGRLTLTLGSFALLLIPTTIVVAIEQPRWLDTDAVIRKSFIYGALSIGIFLVYAAIAAGLGLAAGARLPLEVAIVVTAVLAFAFQPVRARLQSIADRWVFGERPSRISAVADFDRSLRDSGAAGDLSERLAETVRQAARLRWVTVELQPEPELTSGERTGEPVHVAQISNGEDHFGAIHCGPPVSGGFKDRDADLVNALAGQAALVVSNARLAARIVHAQEAERRRLERNIHDGAQQELVALVAKLGLARAKTKKGTLDEATLIELQRDAGAILKDLRDLAQGIHPTVLTDGGLVEAVEDRCSRLPIDVVVETSPGLRSHRFEDDVEGAAYFFVTEGLTNVLKHAEASAARVELRRSNGDLELTVTDNGEGFDPRAIRWNGLAGLTDRFTALAGNVTLDAGSGRGTVLQGRIPIETPA
jgi:signal transduction histidine kinase